MHPYIHPLAQKLSVAANPDDAVWAKKYMKGQFEFFGIKSPARNAIFKEFWAEYRLPRFEDLEPLITELFDMPEREYHYFAIELTARFKMQCTSESLALLEKMVLLRSWWDSVDYINSVCLRPYFKKFPEDSAEITQRWIDSGNMWLQRLSVICQLGLRDKTDIALLFRNILLLNTSKEFFIQKAIGWALRELGKTYPETVIEFVNENDLKPLSSREALKHLRDKNA